MLFKVEDQPDEGAKTMDRATVLLNYITSTLSNRSFAVYKDAYYWAGEDLDITPDLEHLTSGWLVILETDPYAMYVNFAGNVPAPMREQLKTLIGHCVVEGIACHTPWRVTATELPSNVREQIGALLH